MVKQKRESANSKTSHLKLCSQKQKEKRMKIKESLRDIWDRCVNTQRRVLEKIEISERNIPRLEI